MNDMTEAEFVAACIRGDIAKQAAALEAVAHLMPAIAAHRVPSPDWTIRQLGDIRVTVACIDDYRAGDDLVRATFRVLHDAITASDLYSGTVVRDTSGERVPVEDDRATCLVAFYRRGDGPEIGVEVLLKLRGHDR